MKLCLVAMLLCLSKTESIHPYNILGVRSSDSQAKIKSAYKNLARQWHPDKNKSPDAAKKMMEINEAYEILSDPERKTQFDMYGTTDEQSNRASHFHHESRRGPDQHFSFMFEDMPFGSRHRWKRKNVLTRYAYNNIVLPDSHHKLFLIAVFEEMSFECMKLFPLWEKLTTNLENIGIGTYEMHFSEDPRLAHDLGVNWWPGFVAIVGGRPIKYKDYEKSERVIRDFLATVLPHDNIDHINSETAKEYFEQSFHDNKPQCLLFSKHMFPPLLFLSVAYEYRSKVKFFYVDVKDPGTERLREKYEVSKSDPTIVMLKEEPSDPVEIVRGNALRRGKLRELIAKNLYFHVPRLSSPKLFEDLCPKKYAADRWFCMVVVYEKNSNFTKSLLKFRQISKEERLSNKRFRFLYVYEDVQTSLMNDLNVDQQTKPLLCNDGRPAAKLVTLQRGGTGRIRYSWFPGGWCVDSRPALLRYIGQLDAGEEVLEHETQSVHIVDELQHGYLWSFVKRTYKFVQHINDSLEHPSWSNVTSIFFVLLVVFGLTIGCIIPLLTDYFWDIDDTTELPRHRKPPTGTCVLGLEKLYDKTQKTLINNAERGQICVAVVLDVSAIEDVAMSPIAQAFSDAIYNFTSDPQFKFTWVSLPEQLLWCTEVMQIKKFGEFLPGTVIAMNGFRKYSYKFRPNIGGEDQPQISAKFVGFESSDDESDGYAHLERVKSKRAALRLRSDLPAWLERLLDGTLLKDKTKHVEWPTMEVT